MHTRVCVRVCMHVYECGGAESAQGLLTFPFLIWGWGWLWCRGKKRKNKDHSASSHGRCVRSLITLTVLVPSLCTGYQSCYPWDLLSGPQGRAGGLRRCGHILRWAVRFPFLYIPFCPQDKRFQEEGGTQSRLPPEPALRHTQNPSAFSFWNQGT